MDREVGYCQGSAFIVGLLLMQVIGISVQTHSENPKPQKPHRVISPSDVTVVLAADAGGGGLLRVCQADAGLQTARALQAQYGGAGTLHVPV